MRIVEAGQALVQSGVVRASLLPARELGSDLHYSAGTESGSGTCLADLLEAVEIELADKTLEARVPEVLGEDVLLQASRVLDLEGRTVCGRNNCGHHAAPRKEASVIVIGDAQSTKVHGEGRPKGGTQRTISLRESPEPRPGMNVVRASCEPRPAHCDRLGVQKGTQRNPDESTCSNVSVADPRHTSMPKSEDVVVTGSTWGFCERILNS